MIDQIGDAVDTYLKWAKKSSKDLANDERDERSYSSRCRVG